MVGGIIIGLSRTEKGTLVNVRDKTYGDTCAVRVLEKRRFGDEPVKLEIGDSIWWQGNDAIWTSKILADKSISEAGRCQYDWDIHIPKIGFSH